MGLYAFDIRGAVRAQIAAEGFAEAFYISPVLQHCCNVGPSYTSVLRFEYDLLNSDLDAHFGKLSYHPLSPFGSLESAVVQILLEGGLLVIKK